MSSGWAPSRHPAVVASAITTIQALSRGPAVLGIARGDSALAYLGRRPMPLANFCNALRQVQTYLRGDAVDCEGFPSRLEWLRRGGLPTPTRTLSGLATSSAAA